MGLWLAAVLSPGFSGNVVYPLRNGMGDRLAKSHRSICARNDVLLTILMWSRLTQHPAPKPCLSVV